MTLTLTVTLLQTAGAALAFCTVLVGLVVAIRKSSENGRQIAEVHLLVNSRLDQITKDAASARAESAATSLSLRQAQEHITMLEKLLLGVPAPALPIAGLTGEESAIEVAAAAQRAAVLAVTAAAAAANLVATAKGVAADLARVPPSVPAAAPSLLPPPDAPPDTPL